MAFFIQIKDKCFKFPVRTIIGRGEPFSIFNENHEIARSHLLVVQKKNKIYIKDLGSKSGSFLNGKKLKKDQLTQFNDKDSLIIGGIPINLLVTAPSEFIEISGTQNVFKNISDKFFLAIPGIPFIFLSIHDFLDWRQDGVFTKFVIDLIFNLFVCSIIYMFVKLFILIMKRISPPQVNEVYFSKEGITAHYDDGSNMTFKFSTLESWDIDSHHNIFLKMNGKIETIPKLNWKQCDKVLTILNAEIPEKKFKTATSKFQKVLRVVMVLFGLLLFGAWQNPIIFPSEYVDVVFWMVILFGISALMSQKVRDHWIIPVSASFNHKKQSNSIILALVVAAYFQFEYKLSIKNISNFKSCVKNNLESCKEVDFFDVDSLTKVNPQVVFQACELGNKSACYKSKQYRGIAGEKREK